MHIEICPHAVTQLTLIFALLQVVDRAVESDHESSDQQSHNKGNDHRKDVQVGRHHTLVPGQFDVSHLVGRLALQMHMLCKCFLSEYTR